MRDSEKTRDIEGNMRPNVIVTTGRMHTSNRMLPDNCEAVEGRCPRCRQVHLRPKFCQALVPGWVARVPMAANRPANTTLVRLNDEADEANKSNIEAAQSNFDKAAYQRDYMRKRREAARAVRDAATEAGDDD